MSTWGEIARRAAEATGPDYYLDCSAHEVAFGRASLMAKQDHEFAYSSSVDAMLALIAEKLPGYIIDYVAHEAGGVAGALKPIGAAVKLTNGENEVPANASCIALALIAAFALAIEAEEASQGKEGERG